MGRLVTLVLLDASGAVLGSAPPFEVPEPGWHDVAPVIAGAFRAGLLPPGVDLQILRLLDVDPPTGRITYLAQLSGSSGAAPVLSPVDVDLSLPAGRAPYAEPDGPAATVRWAVSTMDAIGAGPVTAMQQRTWNLSAIWRLDRAGEPVAWLKQVPGFYRHEPQVLDLVALRAPGLVPRLLARGAAGRMILAHLPGRDGRSADPVDCAATAGRLHPAQAYFAHRHGEIRAAGVPDGRLTADDFAATAEPYLATIDGLGELVAGLPARLADIAACGVPDTLLHGDLHPGNARIDGGTATILDWGDAVLGHPAYDLLRLTARLPEPGRGEVVRAWAERWRQEVPGSDPERAVDLLRPVELVRRAVVNTAFLNAVEPSEQVYHRADVVRALAAAVSRVGG